MSTADLESLLTYSTVQSPSWAANWFSANVEIPRISRNPKVHYCTHKRPPPVYILGPPNPVHLIWFDLFAFHWSIQDYKIHKDIEIVNCDQYKIKYIY